MAYAAHVRGLLLEEVVLFLLETSGYRTVERADVEDDDPLLHPGSAGIELLGRGAWHQIDAIADYIISHPFSHQQRLLVEAKCYAPTRRVGIDVIRNAVGVLKDVSEHWVTVGPKATVSKQRFHYQTAVFSATGYTSGAEDYAFAHDIYLIPLTFSRFLRDVIDLIHQITPAAFGSDTENIAIDLQALRQSFRNAIRPRRRERLSIDEVVDASEARQLLRQLTEETQRIGGAALAMINNRFPVFLVPRPGIHLGELPDHIRVRIRWDDTSWYLDSADDRPLFSFDLPPELFERYAEQDLLKGKSRLSPEQALNLKGDVLSEIQATVVVNGRIRVLTFSLDTDWLDSVRHQLARMKH